MTPSPADASADNGGSCGLCDYLESSPLAGWIHEDHLFKAGIYPTNEVPGWIAVVLGRHAEATSELTPEEAEAIGPLLVRLSTAIEEATDAVRVYLQVFNERFRHWHVLMSARGPEVPEEHWQVGFLAHMTDYVDVPAAELAGGRIREALARA